MQPTKLYKTYSSLWPINFRWGATDVCNAEVTYILEVILRQVNEGDDQTAGCSKALDAGGEVVRYSADPRSRPDEDNTLPQQSDRPP